MALTNCPECQKQISDTSHKCIGCGAELKKCPECGLLITQDKEICPGCGFSFAEAKEQPTAENKSEPITYESTKRFVDDCKKDYGGRSITIFFAIIQVIAFMGAIVVFFVKVFTSIDSATIGSGYLIFPVIFSIIPLAQFGNHILFINGSRYIIRKYREKELDAFASAKVINDYVPKGRQEKKYKNVLLNQFREGLYHEADLGSGKAAMALAIVKTVINGMFAIPCLIYAYKIALVIDKLPDAPNSGNWFMLKEIGLAFTHPTVLVGLILIITYAVFMFVPLIISKVQTKRRNKWFENEIKRMDTKVEDTVEEAQNA